MSEKKTELNKVLNIWDILVLAFGAMIGWAWVVSTGDWIMQGGVAGAMLGFGLGGVMIFFVGLAYAELTTTMPQNGGEHVFSYRALGKIGSFICTWAIIFGYTGVVCFEACALPTIFAYLYPGFLQYYLYTVGGFDIYATWLALAFFLVVFITYINIIGAKTAAILQTVLTLVIGGVGIVLIAASGFTGSEANLQGQLFMGDSTQEMIKNTLAVAVMTPFFFIGFNVIPQAAEEISAPLKHIGRILVLSIVLAVAFYSLVIGAVGFLMNNAMIGDAMNRVGGLVTADAMAIAFNSDAMAKVLIIGGSRALYSMACAHMIPPCFAKLHPKYKTPVNALILLGIITTIAVFFGKKMLLWVVDAGNFGCVLAYFMVSVSFLVLRVKEPDMERPYKVGPYRFVGIMAVLMSGFMLVMYVVPSSGSALYPQEWGMVLGWTLLGLIFGVYCKLRYKEKFAAQEYFIRTEAIEEVVEAVEKESTVQ